MQFLYAFITGGLICSIRAKFLRVLSKSERQNRHRL